MATIQIGTTIKPGFLLKEGRDGKFLDGTIKHFGKDNVKQLIKK